MTQKKCFVSKWTLAPATVDKSCRRFLSTVWDLPVMRLLKQFYSPKKVIIKSLWRHLVESSTQWTICTKADEKVETAGERNQTRIFRQDKTPRAAFHCAPRLRLSVEQWRANLVVGSWLESEFPSDGINKSNIEAHSPFLTLTHIALISAYPHPASAAR